MKPVTIRVDNCVRMHMPDIPDDVLDAIKLAFTFDNPSYHLHRRLQIPGWWKNPQEIGTWGEEDEEIVIPRGGLREVRDILESHDIPYKLRDKRVEGGTVESFPKFRGIEGSWKSYDDLHYYQLEAIDAVLKRENCSVRLPTGCISGDAVVGVNRAGISREITMRDLCLYHAGGRSTKRGWEVGKAWDPNIETKIRMRTTDGHIRLGSLVDIWSSGVKETFLVKTRSGKKIRATKDHRFLTEHGWKRLGRIGVGTKLFVEDECVGVATKKPKPWYRLVNGLKHHPYAGRRGVNPAKGGWSVPKHRLVAEARMNSMDIDQFIETVRQGSTRALHFLDPKKFVVHHIDEDALNNDPKNLEVMTKEEHRAHHAKDGWKHIARKTVLDEVIGIGHPLMEETYDLEVLEEDHNFIANEFVVHNSGKSIMAIALAAKIGLNTLVILPTVGLFKQWVEDAKSVLDTDDIGIIHQKKCKLRPITAAVQGTLAQGISEEILDYFGVVMVDECQKAAASTYMRVVGAFPARYRIGISADERRQDKKEFLTKGLFGEVVYEKKRKELEQEGFIVDVEIRVVPTDFEADWYGLPPEKKKKDDEEEEDIDPEDPKEIDFRRLIDEMRGDEKRNALGLKFALKEVDTGEQVLILSHRREHCIEIEREFVKRQIASGYFIGGPDYATEFEKTRAGIKDGSIRVGVGTYGALGVGVNLPKVGVGVAMTPIAGNRFNFNQVRGRLNRKGGGKSRAVLYTLWDRKVYPKHLKNMVAWNPTVKVYDNGKWVEGRYYLKALKKKAEDLFT